MELSERLEQAHIESQGLLKLMDKGDLSDFYRLKPISGLTLLATCAAIDDRTHEKAKSLLREWNREA